MSPGCNRSQVRLEFCDGSAALPQGAPLQLTSTKAVATGGRIRPRQRQSPLSGDVSHAKRALKRPSLHCRRRHWRASGRQAPRLRPRRCRCRRHLLGRAPRSRPAAGAAAASRLTDVSCSRLWQQGVTARITSTCHSRLWQRCHSMHDRRTSFTGHCDHCEDCRPPPPPPRQHQAKASEAPRHVEPTVGPASIQEHSGIGQADRLHAESLVTEREPGQKKSMRQPCEICTASSCSACQRVRTARAAWGRGG